jgi:hypothetical protein
MTEAKRMSAERLETLRQIAEATFAPDQGCWIKCDPATIIRKSELLLLLARAKRLEEALRLIAEHLECGPREADRTHYCGNCGNSLFDALEIARTTLGETPQER